MRIAVVLFFLCCLSTMLNAEIIKLGDGVEPGDNAHPHNLSSNSTATIHSTDEDRICVFCHTPHGGSTGGPLWNRPNPSGTFTVNTRASLQVDTVSDYNNTDFPNGSSKLCMSCHDGVTAIGNFLVGSATMVGGVDTMSVAGTIQLDRTHPVSFTYDSVVVDALTPTVNNFHMPDSDSPVNVDGLSRVQCTTCHDPHAHTRHSGYTLPMWRIYTGNSTSDRISTCTACHQGSPGSNPHSM